MSDFQRVFLPKKNIIFVCLLLLYFSALLYLAYSLNVWEDETYSLNTTSRDIIDVVKQSYNFEGQLPVYFVLLALWRSINQSIFFARLLSILFIAGSGFYFYKLVHLTGEKKNSKWLVATFLLNPFIVWTAVEIRMYALLILLSVLTIYYFILYCKKDERKDLFTFLIFCLIGLYTQYFFGFLIGALYVTFWIFRGWKSFFRLCQYFIPIALLFLPNLFFLPGQISITIASSYKDSFIDTTLHVFSTAQNLMLGINLVPEIIINRTIRIVFACFLLCGYIILYNNSVAKRTKFKFYNGIIITIFFFLIFFSIGIYLTDIIFSSKYIAVILPLIMLLFIIFSGYPLKVKRIIYLSLIIYFTLIQLFYYRNPVKTYDYIAVARYIETIEYPNEPILIYRPGIALPFNYYYHGSNKTIPIPTSVNFDSSYLINMDTSELKKCIQKLNITSNSFLLLSDLTKYESRLNMNREMISEYLQSHYKVTLDTLYIGHSQNRPLRIRRVEKIYTAW